MTEVIFLWEEEQSRKFSGSSFSFIFAPSGVLLRNPSLVMKGHAALHFMALSSAFTST